MKHFLTIYSIYFTLLMVVPCNHTALYSNLLKQVFDIDMHEHCSHQHDNQSPKNHSHHHSCTPFCACGIAQFVLNAPSYPSFMFQSTAIVSQHNILVQATIWTNPNEHCCLKINNIWHPPQFI